LKCAGLSDAQRRIASAAPSKLTLLGLMRHMTDVERYWFRRRIAGEEVPPWYWEDASPDGDFENLDDADYATVLERWEAECARSRSIIDSVDDLERLTHNAAGDPRSVSVRWVLIHMVEEYARHNGHADLIRERIDGATGE
jgi:uncharacterized damage-inducible protein DinB